MRFLAAIAILFLTVTALVAQSPNEDGKTKPPIVVKVDAPQLKAAISPKSKPVLVNFWATFCDPCRDEFPYLVKIAADYSGKVDVITVSLDDVSEIDRDVPAFLALMGATMPAFLLTTGDEDGFITSISNQWNGALPFTVIYDRKGAMTYQKLGKFKPEVVREALDRTLAESSQTP